MSDLKLVAPGEPTPLERRLLDAVANESPSVEQRMRVRHALGLSVLVTPPPSAAQAGRATVLGKAAIGTLVAASAIAALVLSGVFQQRASGPNVGTVEAATVLQPRPQQFQGNRVSEPVAAALPPVESAARTRGPRSSAAVTTRASRTAAKSTSISSKGVPVTDGSDEASEQLLLIDSARTAIASGNANAAAQALSTYSVRFPRGSYGQEAAVLRIETVAMQGNRGQAASLARSFLAQHPNSPHVSLVSRFAE